MWELQERHFKDLLGNLFGNHREPEILRCHDRCSSDSLCLCADWLLVDDPSRPNKRSKMIILYFSRELLSDYADGTDKYRQAEDDRIVDLVTTRLNSFDPNHDVPASQIPPSEIWPLEQQHG